MNSTKQAQVSISQPEAGPRDVAAASKTALGPDTGFVSPPPVTRGAKLHESVVSLDWLTFTLPRDRLEDITDLLSTRLGDSWELSAGANFYSASRKWNCGARVCFDGFNDSNRDLLSMSITGDGMMMFGKKRAMTIIRECISWGGRCTRIDVALDFRGNRVGLIDNVQASCRSHELCRSRKFRVIEESTNDGRCTGRTVYLGTRGKNGSGRYVRVYDKGLESGQASEGEYERWEVEHTQDVATQVAEELNNAENWQSTAVSIALGAVDFRIANGSAALARRPLCSWWADLLNGVTVKTVRIVRRLPTLESYTAWWDRCIVPRLDDIAKSCDLSRQTVIGLLTSDSDRSRSNGHKHPLVQQFKIFHELGSKDLTYVA